MKIADQWWVQDIISCDPWLFLGNISLQYRMCNHHRLGLCPRPMKI